MNPRAPTCSCRRVEKLRLRAVILVITHVSRETLDSRKRGMQKSRPFFRADYIVRTFYSDICGFGFVAMLIVLLLLLLFTKH